MKVSKFIQLNRDTFMIYSSCGISRKKLCDSKLILNKDIIEIPASATPKKCFPKTNMFLYSIMCSSRDVIDDLVTWRKDLNNLMMRLRKVAVTQVIGMHLLTQ